MKSYRITDEFSIVPNGNVLTFEIGAATVRNLNDDDIAKLLNEIIGVIFAPNVLTTYTWEQVDSMGSVTRITIRHNDDKDYKLVCEIIAPSGDIIPLYTVQDRWVLIKLMNILTKLLATMCEEGV